MMEFTLSIEPVDGGQTVLHPFHLGTDLDVARQIAEERHRNPVDRVAAKTVAIKRGGKVVDVFDGSSWASRFGFDD